MVNTTWERSIISNDRTYHLVDGNPMYRERFNEVLSFHSPGLAPVKKDGKWFHIDSHGIPIYGGRYDRAWGYYDGLAAVVRDGEYFHIDSGGKPTYREKYLWCGNFQNGLCSVQFKNSRYGHILPDGKRAYSESYSYAGDYRESYAVVQLDNGNSVHIDRNGRMLNGKEFLDLTPFHKGIASAKDSAGWFHVNMEGKPIYEERYESIEPFYNGQARAITKFGEIKIINEQGDTLSTIRGRLKTPLQMLSNKMVGFWMTELIFTSVKLGVFDQLPGTSDKISRGLNIETDKAERLLKALWELGLVIKNRNFWTLTEEGILLTKDSNFDMSSVIINWREIHMRPWGQLFESLKERNSDENLPIEKGFFNSLAKNTEQLKIYQKAMDTYALHDYEVISKLINLKGNEIVADIGGGSGRLLWNLKKKYPDISGIVFDLKEVIAIIKEQKMERGINYVAGDMFQPLPFSPNVILLCRVLHDWNDKDVSIILKNVRTSLLEGGIVYMIEYTLKPEIPAGGMLDMNMLCCTGGRERTLEEIQILLKNAGLTLIKATPTSTFGFLIEAGVMIK